MGLAEPLKNITRKCRIDTDLEDIGDYLSRAECYIYLQNRDKASADLDQCVKLLRSINHPAASFITRLAVLYKDQAQYEKAEPLFIEAIEGRRLKLGDTHPHTIESLNTLIALYETCNKQEKAQEWRAKLSGTEIVE